MKKSLLCVAAVAASLCAVHPILANEEGGSKPPEQQAYKAFTGKITAVNAQTSTITFTNKAGESHSFTIPGNVPVEVNGKTATLADLAIDMYGGVKLDANDTPFLVKAYAPKPAEGTPPPSGQPAQNYKYFTGKITAVNSETSTITFTNKAGESHSVTIPANTPVRINDKEGAFTDLKVDMYGGVKMDAHDTPLMVMASSNQPSTGTNSGSGQPAQTYKYFTGKVTAVDAQNSTVTFTNKAGESHAFTVPGNLPVQVNGKAGSLADLTADMYGGIKMDANGTPVMLMAYTPKAPENKPAG